jgi:Ser/Thr protein kinase RdoA (MazF antagonist)
MDQQLVERILQMNGIQAVRILPSQKGYRNTSTPVICHDGRQLNLIMYKDEPGILQRIQRADAVSNYLAQHGLPSRQSCSRIICLSSGRRTRYARLYSYLPGETIPWEAYTMHHIKLLGKTMSDMHALLRDYRHAPQLRVPAISDEMQNLRDEMIDYFNQSGVMPAMERKLGLQFGNPSSVFLWLHTMPLIAEDEPGAQLLHMDFVRGNLVFGDTGHSLDSAGDGPFLSGILDFEKCAYGLPAFDAARTLAFLLVDCKYKSGDKVIKYFLESGYQKRGANRLDGLQEELTVMLARWFLFYDFYKFLRHNPYEYLSQNEHFVRTRDLLVKYGIVKLTPNKRGNHASRLEETTDFAK